MEYIKIVHFNKTNVMIYINITLHQNNINIVLVNVHYNYNILMEISV